MVGKNVSWASAQIRAVSKRLSEVNQLTLEVPTYVLQGMTKCYVPEFTGPFDLMLNQERVTHMATPVSLVNTSNDTLKHVLDILHLANNSYHCLNTSNDWNVLQGKRGHHAARHPHHPPICFNCDNPHLLLDCKFSRDEAEIARNRKACMVKRSNYPPRNGGRKKWTKGGQGDGTDISHGSWVQLIGNKWM